MEVKMLDKITVLISVDDKHLNELKITYPTWIKFKKEFLQFKYKIIYDVDQLKDTDERFNIFKDSKIEIIPWKNNIKYGSQREKMITSLVFSPRYVDTQWYLKIDTDTMATNSEKWIDEKWFLDNVFISNPWGYTKPADAIQKLDNWANKLDFFASTSPLNIFPQPGAKSVSHSRIISWIFFGNTEWSKRNISIFKEEILPIPSQDTLCHYIAERKKEKYLRIRFKNFGWTHRKI